MNLAKKALSLGTSAALVASLLATVVAPSVAASTLVGSAGTVPVGGTSTAASSFQFCENAAGDWHAGGTITVTIAPYSAGGSVTFTNSTGGAPSPTFSQNPGGLGGATATAGGNLLTVTVPTDDNTNALCFTVGNLYITAAAGTTTGAIQATTGGTIAASTYSSTTTTATGYLVASQASTATSFTVNVTSACPFVPVGSGVGPAGDFVIAGVDAGATGSATTLTNGQQTLAGLTPAQLGTATTAYQTVQQLLVPNCSASTLASPGTVGAAVTQTATSMNVNPGEQNQLAGTTTIVETGAGVLAANTVLTYTISAPTSGVTFSSSPTVTAGGTAGLALAAPSGLSGSVTAPTTPVTYGAVAAGTYNFVVTAVDGGAIETLPSAAATATLTNTGAVALSWTGSFGSATFNIYGKTASGTTYALIHAGNATTSYLVATAASAWTATTNPPTTSTSLVAAPTGVVGSPENNVTASNPGTVAAGTYYFEVTAVGVTGETTPSAAATVVVATANSKISLTWAAVPGAASYKVYEAGSLVGPFGYLASSSSASASVTATPAPTTAVPPVTNNAVGTSTGGLVLSSSLCALNVGSTSCSVTVTTASTSPATVVLSNIHLDMANSVPAGTAVNITVTASPAITVNVSSNTIANASRVIAGVASQPTIYINYNAQPSGMITLTEAGPGFFTSSGVNDAFGLCLTTGESFTYTPYAIVASGDLKLLSSTSTAATTLQGTQYTANGWSCVSWSVYSASTVASTIDIVGATASGPLAIGAANGPTLSVPGSLMPGTTQSWILVGAQADVAAADTAARSSLVSNATRAFKSGVVVAAVSQPYVSVGTADTVAGNLTISETLNGQFKPGQFVCVTILPRATNGTRTQDTFIKTTTTNDLPVISTNAASGLLTSSVATPGCAPSFTTTVYYNASYDNFDYSTAVVPVPGPFLPTPGASFGFVVNQQSFGGTLGTITISNIHLTTTADAVVGPVLVDVMGDNGDGGQTSIGGAVPFESVVSNAKIGTPAKLNIAANSALGLNPTSGYTMLTPKYQAVGKYVTWKFTGGPALAGQRVNVLVAKHINGAWGGPVYYKSAWADANGIVTFAWTSKTAAAINVRVQWPGSAANAVSTSKALGAYYK